VQETCPDADLSSFVLEADQDAWVRVLYRREPPYYLWHGIDEQLELGYSDGGPASDIALIHFDLGAIPAAQRVVDARLELYAFGAGSSSGAAVAITAYLATSHWVERTYDPDHPATADIALPAQGDRIDSVPVREGSWNTMDLMDAVPSWQYLGQNHGVFLLADRPADSLHWSVTLGSRESDLRPRLRLQTRCVVPIYLPWGVAQH
jgi:hypothetical protein